MEDVDPFLLPYCPEYIIDTQEPASFSTIATPDNFLEFRYKLQKAMEQVPEIAQKVNDEFRSRFGAATGPLKGTGRREQRFS